MTCEICKYYYQEPGSEGRWMLCNNPKMRIANVYESLSNLKDNGIGYNDNIEKDNSMLFVGKNFGCIHFENK